MNSVNKHLAVWLLLLYCNTLNVFAQQDSNPQYATLMWYDKPALNWNEALPIGNGRLGAMVYGGVLTEQISLNEQTLWSGGPRNWNNPEAKKYLPLVREAALDGKYKKADSLSHFMQGPYTESYMPMADLLVHFPGIADSTHYKRSLNLDSAVCTTVFSDPNKTYSRNAFASFPDKAIILHYSCNKKANISFKAVLTSKLHFKVFTISERHIVLRGKCPEHVEPAYRWQIKGDSAVQYAADEHGEGMTFEVHLYVKNESGTISVQDNTIVVENADAATLIISAATSFNGYKKSPGLAGKNPAIEATKNLTAAMAKPFKVLLQRHVTDYQPLFRRVYVNLGESKNNHLPANERLKQMEFYTDPELVAMISQFGRYILIAGSRAGGQPVNLKGIWNDKVRPEYSSNWCLDHDAQMFYYGVETNHLPEMHEPFLQMISDLAENGKQTAAINYGMNGWCAHHNTDIWRSTGAGGNWGEGNPHWATWNMAGAWLSGHLFEHYSFTGDRQFLAEKAWPIMKGAAEFCLDWLITSKSGQFISVPSVSPENTFITEKGDTAQISVNSTSDIALIKQLFTNCIRAAHILKTDQEFCEKLKKAIGKLPAYRIGSKQQLLEWTSGEWNAVDPGHRHLSHMYPVFPGDEISPITTPQLSEAAKKALSLRTKTNCSWGFAWKAACWARLGEGDSAWQTWQYQLQYMDPSPPAQPGKYGLFPNFFSSEGDAVILNGNGCATAVLTEMLLQSHTDAIQLLPALPKTFANGTIKGICARNGFHIDLTWANHQLVKSTITSTLGNECRIRPGKKIKIYEQGKEKKVTKEGNETYVFNTEMGQRYTIIAQ